MAERPLRCTMDGSKCIKSDPVLIPTCNNCCCSRCSCPRQSECRHWCCRKNWSVTWHQSTPATERNKKKIMFQYSVDLFFLMSEIIKAETMFQIVLFFFSCTHFAEWSSPLWWPDGSCLGTGSSRFLDQLLAESLLWWVESGGSHRGTWLWSRPPCGEEHTVRGKRLVYRSVLTKAELWTVYLPRGTNTFPNAEVA